MENVAFKQSGKALAVSMTLYMPVEEGSASEAIEQVKGMTRAVEQTVKEWGATVSVREVLITP